MWEREREREWKGEAQSTPVQGVRSHRKSFGNLPSREIKHKGWYKNYDAQLLGEIMSGNYYRKLSVEIITGNY